MVQRELTRHGGRLCADLGDGTLSTFTSPGQAVRDAAGHLGLELRLGLHAGEVEMRGTDLAGLTVHTAGRVASQAEDGEVLTTATVVVLLLGIELTFEDRGLHELQGVPRARRLWAATGRS